MSKTLLVTGASKGIGFETVRRFFQADNDVTDFVLVARDSEAFTAGVAQLNDENPYGKKLFPYVLDLADRMQTSASERADALRADQEAAQERATVLLGVTGVVALLLAAAAAAMPARGTAGAAGDTGARAPAPRAAPSAVGLRCKSAPG